MQHLLLCCYTSMKLSASKLFAIHTLIIHKSTVSETKVLKLKEASIQNLCLNWLKLNFFVCRIIYIYFFLLYTNIWSMVVLEKLNVSHQLNIIVYRYEGLTKF